MTYGELQDGQGYGFLLDPVTGERYSADRRDYWFAPDDAEIDGLILARENVEIEVLAS